MLANPGTVLAAANVVADRAGYRLYPYDLGKVLQVAKRQRTVVDRANWMIIASCIPTGGNVASGEEVRVGVLKISDDGGEDTLREFARAQHERVRALIPCDGEP